MMEDEHLLTKSSMFTMYNMPLVLFMYIIIHVSVEHKSNKINN